MQTKDLLALMSNKKVQEDADNTSLAEVEKEIKVALQKKLQREGSANIEREQTELFINQYISDHIENWKLKDYIDDQGFIDRAKLTKRIVDDILNLGIIEKVMRDKNVEEIRGLGRWVCYVDTKGRTKFIKDENGELVPFRTPAEQEAILKKMLVDINDTVNNKFKLVNGRTIEGYRLSVTHSSAKSRSNIPEENGYCDFTLRKFRNEIFSLKELVKQGALSDDMARLMKFIVSNESYAIVGPTFSGKTTFNRSVLEYIPNDMRVICIQSPTEFDLRKFGKNGCIINDRVMWEADGDAAQTDSNGNSINYTNTLQNCIDQTLRNSPEIVAINEVRHNNECHSLVLIGQAGHLVNTTFHAFDPYDACKVFTNRVITETGQRFEIGMQDTTGIFKFIVVQRKLKDGSRRVVSISEIMGVDENDPTKPKVNTLYKFKTLKVERDEDGHPINIIGEHRKVGNISDALKERLSLNGYTDEDFKVLDKDYKDPNYKITYNGDGV